MRIRLASAGDADELQKLNALFNGDDYYCNSPDGIAASLEENQQEIVCVAEEGDALVGFCCGQLFKSICYSVNYGEITELFVAEEYRRRGVAAKLIAFIEAEFQKRGANGFQLFTGEENAAAQAFYRSQGYSETSETMFRKRIERESK
ncbi:MAG: GNAT family N-acetyltransferase [Oscillospiraceae bacterium]|nr:GNAT family N-acetyltransferase [Oscillospiraceae bacterium]